MFKRELLNRINHLQQRMILQNLDTYIITAEEDIWYFTNITYKPEERPFFLIIYPKQQPIFVVPKLEESHVKKGILDCKVHTYWDYPSATGENWHEVLHCLLRTRTKIGIEENVKVDIFLNITAKKLVSINLVAEQRKIKSPYELEKIKHSARMTDKAMRMIFKTVYKGASVIEPFAVSRNIQNELIRTKQFDPITTSLLTAVWPTPISAMPHGVPNLHDRLGKGPNVAMAYFRINGYAAECERTFFLEKPSKEEETLFQHMMEARIRALSVVKAGVKATDVDAVAKNYLIKTGLKENLLHRTGHGVGLGNHEAPFIAEGSRDVLEENMVITVEPGIYIEGIGGYRHSDTILVTKDGYELLTTAPLGLDDMLITKTSMLAQVKGKIIRKSMKID